jgi:hypothetical protein
MDSNYHWNHTIIPLGATAMIIFALTLATLLMSYLALTHWRDQKRAAKLQPIPIKIESAGTTHKKSR